MRSIFIFFVFLSFHWNECISTKTILFIYGNTNMTEYDVKELSENLENISKDKLFKDGFDFNFKIILPNISYVVEIINSTKPRTSNNYSIKGQSILKSLQTQLQECPDHSVINIITNAAAPDDVNLIPNILELIQIKRIEVNFLIQTEDELPITSLPEYKLITIISNGFIVCSELPKFGFDLRPSLRLIEFPGSLNSWLKSIKQKVTLLAVHRVGNYRHCIHLDPFLKQEEKEMIFTRGLQLHFVLKYSYTLEVRRFGPEFNIFHDHPSKIQECVKIGRMLTENSPLLYGLRIIDRSDFDIDYGFSTDAVRSLNETRKRPITSKLEKIYVTSSNKTFQATFNSFSVLFLNGSFQSPKQHYFNIKVTAHVKKKKVYRLSQTAMNAADEYNKSEKNSTNVQLYDNATSFLISKIKKVI